MSDETALVRQPMTVIAPRTLDEVVTLSEKLAKSSLLPEALRGKVPEVMMQIMSGQELGLAPMASLRSFSIIQGKPVMSADAMVALVLGSGKCEYFRRVSESDKEVTYATKRRGEPERRCQWTIEMAKQAALHQKDNWRTFPRAMLASRAKSELARDVYPDVLAGVFTADELDVTRENLAARDAEFASVRAAERIAEDAEFVETKFTDSTIAQLGSPFSPSDYPEFAELDSTTSVKECQDIAGRFAKRGLRPGHPAYEAMNAKYKAKIAGLRKGAPAPAPSDPPATSSDDVSAEAAP